MFTLRIEPDVGEPFDVTTTSRDITKWEAAGGNKSPRSVSQLADNFRMRDITDLAWFAASRRGLTDLDILQWREGVDVDVTKRPGDKDDAPLICPSCGAEVPTDATGSDEDEGGDEGSGPT